MLEQQGLLLAMLPSLTPKKPQSQYTPGVTALFYLGKSVMLRKLVRRGWFILYLTSELGNGELKVVIDYVVHKGVEYLIIKYRKVSGAYRSFFHVLFV